METKIIHEVITKLSGPIMPVGETHTDDDRFDNLKTLCDVVDQLVREIDTVCYQNKDRVEFSMKRASDYAGEFMTKRLGIVE